MALHTLPGCYFKLAQARQKQRHLGVLQGGSRCVVDGFERRSPGPCARPPTPNVYTPHTA